MRLFSSIFFILSFHALMAQSTIKKILEHKDLVSWNKLSQIQLSRSGDFLLYKVANESTDPCVVIRNVTTQNELKIARASEGRFFGDRLAVIRVKVPLDTLRNLKRRKVAEADLPKDSCYLVNLKTFGIEKLYGIKTWKVTDAVDGSVLGIHLEPLKKTASDTSKVKSKTKAENKDNGSKLIVFQDDQRKEFTFVKDFSLAEKSTSLMFLSMGADSVNKNKLYYVAENGLGTEPILLKESVESLKNLVLHPRGKGCSFMLDLDTSKTNVNRKLQLYFWNNGLLKLVRTDDITNSGLLLSESTAPSFNLKTSNLLFGAAKPLAVQDTNMVPDEVVNVEVWNSVQGKLYTQQNVDVEKDKKKAWLYSYDYQSDSIFQLTDDNFGFARYGDSLDLKHVVVYENKATQVQTAWEGRARVDVSEKNLFTGKLTPVLKNSVAMPNLSPNGKFLYWYDPVDTSWNTYRLSTSVYKKVAGNALSIFCDIENDVPDYPGAYGLATWSSNDQWLFIYDEFDIWKIDPQGQKKPENITNGRSKNTAYRYVNLESENNFLGNRDSILLHYVNKETLQEGYAWYQLSTKSIIPIFYENMHFTQRPVFSRNCESILFSKESFVQFPDWYLVLQKNFGQAQRVTLANPQQKEYNWGSIEIVKWKGPNGKLLKGLLVKPSDFDPTKKYPMLVNFYEKESDNVLNHRAPEAARSSINYPFYASRGYVIFNPDITYETGFPGKSALEVVESGVKYVLSKGFVNPKKVGIQGHSWGGYQIAYILTKSRLFACAESGAPVVNMTSAYGGIRWETGLSRMFQYEKQQSRIGASLWEKREQYIENSPLFEMDKVTTPVLIMSNDKDGHVPWYQGIEYFMALRRLNKPAWLLNYNGEPHWPVKLQNRIDFNIRMQQYFDYYLKDAPMPSWMKEEMKAYEKGIIKGY